MPASLVLEMLGEFQSMVHHQYHSTTPMLLMGEKIAQRMLEFTLVARKTATLEEQFSLTSEDFGVCFATRRSYFPVGGAFTDTQRFRRMLYNGITQQSISMPKEFGEMVHFPPRSYVLARASLALYRATAEQALMTSLMPSEKAWDFICHSLSVNPAKSTEAANRIMMLRERMRSGSTNFEASVNDLISQLFDLSTADDMIPGPYHDPTGLLMCNDWFPMNPPDIAGLELDRNCRAWKIACVGGYSLGHINANGGRGYLSRDELAAGADFLPLSLLQAASANAQKVDQTLPFAHFVSGKDKVDLSEWLRSRQAEYVYSFVIRPPDFEQYDTKPFGYDLWYAVCKIWSKKIKSGCKYGA